ncbi:fungal specific transcription factor domain-containing protein [Stemphylium lycopersici]|uniref:Fungal specific transcription factor domain-containing protein n=1 Tax=Stemphylium lycopersici TaxID=183478 RepID=A0A364N068_STELY|nr:fungal specific transcription factor domain-containing protein [Stemphylium lycopersici]RAR08257.1 fungal specific transcription factor domain-containing protein [Stemphylium lycopersici]
MARKKKSAQADEATNGSASSTPPPPSANGTGAAKKAASEPSTSALIICRNKHWRYISSFHGPWLQLPPEVLESLAHSNYLSPRPHPIDPAVFYDLVKIRKAVDEATTLAVRATSGLTSAALSNSLNGGNGMLGGASALGIGYGGGGTSKLSRERKHRMRELATNKLSQAYHLDEIAASVATMQSASTLEDVAHLVLQREPTNVDAKYVHFFHEKIPSRMMAQCTPLDTLNDIISERPNDGSPLRTRALTRIFKEDYVNSAKDLSEALSTARYMMAQHRAGKDQLVLAKTLQEQYGRDWRQEVKIPDEDQPNSLETQLLFHRAGVYFTIACGHVNAALDGLQGAEEAKARRDAMIAEGKDPDPMTPEEAHANHLRLEARKQVRQNAKRALRDYLAFLSHFDYTPGISPDLAEEFLRRLGTPATTNTNGYGTEKIKPNMNRLIEQTNGASTPISEALVPHRGPPKPNSDRASWPKLPPPEIFKVSQLFDAAPPASLPPYPAPRSSSSDSTASAAATAFADSHEAITYHPLITDALHSLLLCHALVQTPAKEHLRHAHNAARLARVCDGYPIFLAARSPARADWIEVLRRAGNWIGLSTSWENLCRPAPLPGHSNGDKPGSTDVQGKNGTTTTTTNNNGAGGETPTQRRERQKHEAILEALADERVVDEESFQRAVRARERRNAEDEAAEKKRQAYAAQHADEFSSSHNGGPAVDEDGYPVSAKLPAPPKRWAQDDGREYPISTERAEAISRWVRDAPPVGEGAGGATGVKKKRGKGKGRKIGGRVGGVQDGVEGLSLREEEVEEVDE